MTRKRRINVSELKAVVIEEAKCGQLHRSLRVLIGVDSQVALGSIVKGRSSSRPLNMVLRQSLGPAIGFDVYMLPMYYNTKSNPCDGPTRGSRCPPPDMEQPLWWQEMADGVFKKFDEWCLENSVPTAAQPLPYEDLEGHQDLDLRPTAELTKAEAQQQKADSAKPSDEQEVDFFDYHLNPDNLQGDEVLAEEVLNVLRTFDPSQFLITDGVRLGEQPGALDLFSQAVLGLQKL